MGRDAEAFATITDVCQLVDLPAHIPDRRCDRGYTLDLNLTSISLSFPNITSLFH